MPTATDAELEAILLHAELHPLGRIVESSNRAVLVDLGEGLHGIHKPVAFERPLWDYPTGNLASRERAAYLICMAMGLRIVPPTVLREGPWGLGSVQLWIGEPTAPLPEVVTVCRDDEVPDGWLAVLRGEDESGAAVTLAHAATGEVRSAAVLDAVLNNSDRKGGHLAVGPDGLRGFDHGVSLGVEGKLRTVLWGWAGQPLDPADVDAIARLRQAVATEPLRSQLADLITASEIEALERRAAALSAQGRHPLPSQDWPAIPWPAM